MPLLPYTSLLLLLVAAPQSYFFFFFNDTATTEIYTLSLHDALPISFVKAPIATLIAKDYAAKQRAGIDPDRVTDRKSTRLNSSHANISYAVFCLKKKKKKRCFVNERHLTEATVHIVRIHSTRVIAHA